MNRNLTISYRTLVFMVAAVALVASLPFISKVAHADGGPTLSATLSANIPGGIATVSGSGFSAGETVHVSFGAQSKDVVADGSGNISGITLTVPTVPAGLQFVSAFGETSGKWSLTYVWIAGYAPTVTPSSWYILPGAPLTYTGSGFGSNETVTAAYNGATIGTFTTDASGNFSGAASTSLPVSLSNTKAIITFTGATSGAQASATITVGQLYPSITPSTWYTGAGSIISLTGSGFAPNEAIAISAGSVNASSTANAQGSFSVNSLRLPKTGGSVTLTATGASSGASATANIVVTSVSPWITFSTYWAQGGSALTVYGNNFAAGEQVNVISGSQDLGTSTADQSGDFALQTTIPFAPSGTATVTATGADSNASASASLTVAPVYTDLELGAYAGAPGTAVEFIGKGYLPNEPVQITSDRTGNTVIASFNADSNGNFDNKSYVIPAGYTQGNLTFTVVGEHSYDTKSVVYYVTGS